MYVGCLAPILHIQTKKGQNMPYKIGGFSLVRWKAYTHSMTGYASLAGRQDHALL